MNNAGVEIITQSIWWVPLVVWGVAYLFLDTSDKKGADDKRLDLRNWDTWRKIALVLISIVCIFGFFFFQTAQMQVDHAKTKAALEEHYDVILPEEFSLYGVATDANTVIETSARALESDGKRTDDLVMVVKDNNVSLWTQDQDELVELDH